MPTTNFFKSLKKYASSNANIVIGISKFFNAGIVSYVMFGPASLMEFICTTGICLFANDSIKALAQARSSNTIQGHQPHADSSSVTALSKVRSTARSAASSSIIKPHLFLLASFLISKAAAHIDGADRVYFAQANASYSSTSQVIYDLEFDERLTPYIFGSEAQSYFPCPIHNFTQLLACLASTCGNITTVFTWIPSEHDFKEVASNFHYLWLLLRASADGFAKDQDFQKCLLKFINDVAEKSTSYFLAADWKNAMFALKIMGMIFGSTILIPLAIRIYCKINDRRRLRKEEESQRRIMEELYLRDHPDIEALEAIYRFIKNIAPRAQDIPTELSEIILGYIYHYEIKDRDQRRMLEHEEFMREDYEEFKQEHASRKYAESETSPLLSETIVIDMDAHYSDDEKDGRCHAYPTYTSPHGLGTESLDPKEETKEAKDSNAHAGADYGHRFMSP